MDPELRFVGTSGGSRGWRTRKPKNRRAGDRDNRHLHSNLLDPPPRVQERRNAPPLYINVFLFNDKTFKRRCAVGRWAPRRDNEDI